MSSIADQSGERGQRGVTLPASPFLILSETSVVMTPPCSCQSSFPSNLSFHIPPNFSQFLLSFIQFALPSPLPDLLRLLALGETPDRPERAGGVSSATLPSWVW